MTAAALLIALAAVAVALGALLYARHLDGEVHRLRLIATSARAVADGTERTLRETTRRLYVEVDAIRLGSARRDRLAAAEQTRLIPVVPEKG